MMAIISRIFRHVIGEDFAARRAFPADVRRRIAAAIAAQEQRHTGELRFVVEGGLAPVVVLRKVSSRQRAVELFAQLGVWDTEANNGVLICGEMQRCFAEGRFEAGALSGLQAVSDLLAAHFPPVTGRDNPDELPNDPLLL